MGLQAFTMEDGNTTYSANGPWASQYNETNPTGRWAWVARNLHLFQCPSAPVNIKKQGHRIHPEPSDYDLLCSSYGMNSAYLGKNGSSLAAGWISQHGELGIDGWPGYGIGVPGVRDRSRRAAMISRPSETIQLAEHMGDVSNPFTTITDPPFVQSPRTSSGELLPVPGDFGSITGVFTDPGWKNTKESGLVNRASHRNQANYLFVDGRVALMSPWKTCQADYSVTNMWTGL
jgi:prepilin-type processing-associated H-X9-DG protein